MRGILLLALALFIHCTIDAQSTSMDSKLIQRSKKAYRQHDFSRAKRLCLKAIRKDSLENDDDIQILLANILFANKEFNASRKLYYKILSDLDVSDERRTFLQNGIARSQSHIKNEIERNRPKIKFEEEIENGLVTLDSYDKITSLDQMAVHPGCENFDAPRAMDSCLHYYINESITLNFDKRIIKEEGLPEYPVLYLYFDIMPDGNLEDIEVYSIHPLIELEGMRILRGIPKLEPAIFNGQPIAVKEFLHLHL